MDRLIEVLRLMASEARDQKAALPNFVAAADEIALLFADELRVAEEQGQASGLDFETRRQLRMIDGELDQMSGKPELWTPEALERDPAWQSLRRSARGILERLGMEMRPPTLGWLTYTK